MSGGAGPALLLLFISSRDRTAVSKDQYGSFGLPVNNSNLFHRQTLLYITFGCLYTKNKIPLSSVPHQSTVMKCPAADIAKSIPVLLSYCLSHL